MKKTILIFSLALISVWAGAQTIQDALRFSENNYEGSARTMAMGNAFTALGGDLGAVTINPAGSAVAKYSQITISPSLNISVNTAGGTPVPGETSPNAFGNSLTNSLTRFSIPNYGVSMNFDLHRTKGLKNVSIGFVANSTNRFQEGLRTSGEHFGTSFMGSEAYWAYGYDYNELMADGAFDYYNAPWRTIIAAQSGMISNLTDYPEEFIGSSETIDENGNISAAGPLYQSYQRQTRGYKNDYVFNIGFNISDYVYIGANLGITALNYSSALRYTEAAIDPDLFGIEYHIDDGTETGQDITTYFHDMQYDYEYSATGTGIYGKFGVIVTPGGGFRIGAAVQTPVSTTITENWSESGSTTYSDSQFNMSSESPVGEYRYRLISPFRANFGLAYTLGNFGLISVDYELCDYSTMKFKELGMQSGEFDTQNSEIADFMGTSHMLRAGIEIKPIPQFAIRAGYGLTTSPEKAMDQDGNIVYVSSMTDNPGQTMVHKGSFGLGYSSDGSFFADIACSYTRYRYEYIYPYDDYIFDDSGNVITYAPEIQNRRGLWNVMLTLGFRF